MPLRIAFVLIVATTGCETTGAHDATPTPDAPPPTLCTVLPRAYDDLLANAATAEATPPPTRTPGPVPEGSPADTATVDPVIATVREYVACQNAGELFRVYALYTDAYLQRLFYRQDPLTVDAYMALATPEPAEGDERATILDIRNIREFADGRAGAVVTIRFQVIPIPKTFFFTFLQSGDRWLIDDILGEISFSVP